MPGVRNSVARIQSDLARPPQPAVDWVGVSSKLDDAARAGRPLLPILEQSVPFVVAQLRKDAGRESWKALWGHSVDVDQIAHATILAPALVDAVNNLARVPPRSGMVTHAGFEHTYGYLFSTLKTPFGYKRDRWLQPDIEVGLGLPRGTLGPFPAHGTLFSNLTYLAGRIALSDDAGAVAVLEKHASGVAPGIRRFPFASLTWQRLEETASVPRRFGGGVRQVTLRSDFVPFRNPVPGSANRYLLVYSVKDADMPHPQLITAFPVGQSFVDGVVAAPGLGAGQPVTSLYNGYVPGMTDASRSFPGTRTIKKLTVA